MARDCNFRPFVGQREFFLPKKPTPLGTTVIPMCVCFTSYLVIKSCQIGSLALLLSLFFSLFCFFFSRIDVKKKICHKQSQHFSGFAKKFVLGNNRKFIFMIYHSPCKEPFRFAINTTKVLRKLIMAALI